MKKKGKRLVSLLMTAVIIVSTMSTASCAKKNNQNLTMGDWLVLVNQAFGMDSFTNTEPYFANVSTSNEYFATVQTAAEWEVINTKEELDINKNATWEDVLVTLANVGNFTAFDASDEEKVDCIINKLDPSIRKYWMNRDINASDASRLLEAAVVAWAEKKYTDEEEVFEYKVADGTKDLSESEAAKDFVIEGNTITLTDDGSFDIQPGDVYILPGTRENAMTQTAYRCESVQYVDGKLVITNSEEELSLYDIAEEIQVHETYTPDETNTLFYDGYGNLVGSFADIKQASINKSNNVTVASNSGDFVGTYCGTQNVDIDYKEALNNFEMEYNIETQKGNWRIFVTPKMYNGFGVDVKVGFNPKNSHATAYGESSLIIKNLEVTNDIDYGWFKLNSATLRTDFDTEFSFSGGVDYEKNTVWAPKFENAYKSNVCQNWKSKVAKDARTDGYAQTINMGSIRVWGNKAVNVCVDLHLIINVDGSIRFDVSSSNQKGIEYKNGNLRLIHVEDKDKDVSLDASIEIVGSIGISGHIWGVKESIIGFELQVGVGAELTVTAHVVDPENHLIEEGDMGSLPPELYNSMELYTLGYDAQTIEALARSQGKHYKIEKSVVDVHFDVCVDIKVYLVIRFGVAHDCLVQSLAGNSINLQIEICGRDNAVFGHIHMEDGDFMSAIKNAKWGWDVANIDMCTKEFTPFDDEEETEDTEDTENTEDTEYDPEEEGTIVTSDQITLDKYKGFISMGESYYIVVTGLPEGYTLSEIKMSVSDPEIASINSDGVIVGKLPGSVTVTLSLDDKNPDDEIDGYQTEISITVIDPNAGSQVGSF